MRDCHSNSNPSSSRSETVPVNPHHNRNGKSCSWNKRLDMYYRNDPKKYRRKECSVHTHHIPSPHPRAIMGLAIHTLERLWRATLAKRAGEACRESGCLENVWLWGCWSEWYWVARCEKNMHKTTTTKARAPFCLHIIHDNQVIGNFFLWHLGVFFAQSTPHHTTTTTKPHQLQGMAKSHTSGSASNNGSAASSAATPGKKVNKKVAKKSSSSRASLLPVLVLIVGAVALLNYGPPLPVLHEHFEVGQRAATKPFHNMEEFYPFYRKEHSNSNNRLAHVWCVHDRERDTHTYVHPHAYIWRLYMCTHTHTQHTHHTHHTHTHMH